MLLWPECQNRRNAYSRMQEVEALGSKGSAALTFKTHVWRSGGTTWTASAYNYCRGCSFLVPSEANRRKKEPENIIEIVYNERKAWIDKFWENVREKNSHILSDGNEKWDEMDSNFWLDGAALSLLTVRRLRCTQRLGVMRSQQPRGKPLWPT